MDNERLRLEIGKTKIGEKVGTYGGQYMKLSIYYGNYAYPPVKGEYIHLKKESYLELLKTFLETEEGKKYQPPTDKENEEAMSEVANRELLYQTKREEALKRRRAAEVTESPAQIQEKPAEENKEAEEDTQENGIKEVPARKKGRSGKKISRDEMDELTLMYKRQAAILTIAVIFLSLVVALQILLELYLLTR